MSKPRGRGRLASLRTAKSRGFLERNEQSGEWQEMRARG